MVKLENSANYKQIPIDIIGRLYPNLITYEDLPKDDTGELLTEGVYNYTDVADEGNDYLASICYSVWKGIIYILDVVFSDENAEITEPKVANMLIRNNVTVANFESNAGGRYYASNVEKILKEKDINHIKIMTFHQSANKVARIRSEASAVQSCCRFPDNWRDKWPAFYNHLYGFQSNIKMNDHDDGADALTGCVERTIPKVDFLR